MTHPMAGLPASPGIAIEVCLADLTSALAAEAGGATRVELCDNLAEGGTTPSVGMITAVCQALTIPTYVIIRPRGGDFCYTAAELDIMAWDIAAAKAAGAAGVVVGVLQTDGQIDASQTKRLIDDARPLKVTFHRAFDSCCDPLAGLELLLNLGVDFLLTSGQQPTAAAGSPLIRELVARSNGRLRVMAGSGVTATNVAQIIAATGLTDVHAGSACTEWIESPMTYRTSNEAMGSHAAQPTYARRQVTAQRVAELVAAANKKGKNDDPRNTAVFGRDQTNSFTQLLAPPAPR